MIETPEANRLVSTLKRCLKIKGLTYSDLALEMNLSESTVKRLFSSNKLSMQRFERICQVLELSIYDISKMARSEIDGEVSNLLTNEQEQVLADNLDLLIGFHLLLNGWGFDEILEAFKWTKPELIKIFATLDKLKLVSLLPDNRVKVLTASHIRWRKDGAVKKRYLNMVLTEFVADEFVDPGHFLSFDLLELSPASVAILRRKLDLFMKDVNELAELDHSLAQSKKENTGVLIATRPWVFSKALETMSDNYKKDHSYS